MPHARAAAQTSIYATEGDSVDVWQGQKLRVFAANMPSDFTTFYLVNDRNWENGDVYTLSARISGMGDSPLRMSIAAEYPDGSRDYVTSDTKGNGWQHLDLPLKPDKKGISCVWLHSLRALRQGCCHSRLHISDKEARRQCFSVTRFNKGNISALWQIASHCWHRKG